MKTNDKVNPVAGSYATTPETEARNSGSTHCSAIALEPGLYFAQRAVPRTTLEQIIVIKVFGEAPYLQCINYKNGESERVKHWEKFTKIEPPEMLPNLKKRSI